MEYFWIYCLVMLDNIKEIFMNTYGYTLLTTMFAVAAVGIKTFGEGELSFPFGEFLHEKHAPFIKKCLLSVLAVWAVQTSFNVVGTLLPSTGQMVAIYTLGAGAKSETFQAIKDLDPKVAKYLRNKFSETFEDK